MDVKYILLLYLNLNSIVISFLDNGKSQSVWIFFIKPQVWIEY